MISIGVTAQTEDSERGSEPEGIDNLVPCVQTLLESMLEDEKREPAAEPKFESDLAVRSGRMIPPFDIFSVNSDGQLVWQAMVESLTVARVKVKILMDVHPSDYVIRSQRTGHKMVIKADGSITGSPGPAKSEDR